MPSRNVLKIDAPNEYYHVYARGINRQKIYLCREDYVYFLGLLARYLSTVPAKDKNGVAYPHLYGQIELLCYCLMTNHFHLLFYQVNVKAMKTLMQCVMTSYSRYFNKKYKRSGSLFETRYKASMIVGEKYLEHISRYIHLNPKAWRSYPHSSFSYYFSSKHPEWLQPYKIEELFAGREEYLQFLAAHEEQKKMVDEIKYSLANDN